MIQCCRLAVLGWLVLLAGCGSPTPTASVAAEPAPTASDIFAAIDPPAAPGSMAPNLVPLPGGGVGLTWLEPTAEGKSLRWASWRAGAWSEPVTVAAGGDFFANWADLPGAVVTGDGGIVAHWLAKLGGDTYAYGIQLARSVDGGGTFEPIGWLHDDTSPTEHGFVSWVNRGDGDVQAFWLDGRGTTSGGPTALRTVWVGAGPIAASTVVDDRVCDCCATDAASTTAGPVVVYRDRSNAEIRDIWLVRAVGEGWSEPVRVADDGWEIAGCPVNGPAVAADGLHVVVVWFTAAGDQPRVRVAFSDDGGASFGAPIEVDGARPLGRVDVVLRPQGGAVVSWLGGAEGAAAALRLAQVARDGTLGAVEIVATTTAARSSGVPRLVRAGDDLFVAWVEDGEPSRIRLVRRRG